MSDDFERWLRDSLRDAMAGVERPSEPWDDVHRRARRQERVRRTASIFAAAVTVAAAVVVLPALDQTVVRFEPAMPSVAGSSPAEDSTAADASPEAVTGATPQPTVPVPERSVADERPTAIVPPASQRPLEEPPSDESTADEPPPDEPPAEEVDPPVGTSPEPTPNRLSGQAQVEVFYNLEDPSCQAVRAFTREVDKPAVLRGALEELLAGPTAAEQAAGVSSWFSAETAGLLRSVTITDGTANVDFDSRLAELIPNASTACGSQSLLASLDATVLQFPTVERAVYAFDGDPCRFDAFLQRGACG